MQPDADAPQYVTRGGRKVRLHKVHGEWLTVTEMALIAGITREGVLRRLARGDSPEEACRAANPPSTVPPAQPHTWETEASAYTRIRMEGRLVPFNRLRSVYARLEYGLTDKEAFFEALKLFPPLTQAEIERLRGKKSPS